MLFSCIFRDILMIAIILIDKKPNILDSDR